MGSSRVILSSSSGKLPAPAAQTEPSPGTRRAVVTLGAVAGAYVVASTWVSARALRDGYALDGLSAPDDPYIAGLMAVGLALLVGTIGKALRQPWGWWIGLGAAVAGVLAAGHFLDNFLWVSDEFGAPRYFDMFDPDFQERGKALQRTSQLRLGILGMCLVHGVVLLVPAVRRGVGGPGSA